MTKGLFVCFEGSDGAGKSTQARLLAERLQHMGRTVLLTREPGGCEASEKMREILLDKEITLSGLSELLLVFAARNEHLETTIRPALARGEVVICDRFLDSTYAYQVAGRQLDPSLFQILAEAVIGETKPDVVFHLKTLIETLDGRVDRRGKRDRMELQGDAYQARVDDGFKSLREGSLTGLGDGTLGRPLSLPGDLLRGRRTVLDGDGSIDEVGEQVWRFVKEFIRHG